MPVELWAGNYFLYYQKIIEKSTPSVFHFLLYCATLFDMEDFVALIVRYMPYGLLFVLVLTLWALVWLGLWGRKWRMLFRHGGANMEEVLRAIRAHQNESDAERIALCARIDALENAMPQTIRRTGLVRFNPFSDAGGDQSFSLALLDDRKNGVVISSLYGREINRVYAKPIENGSSTYQLSDEEKEAIARATSS